MNAAHAYGEHIILRLPYLLKALCPVFLHGIAICAIVEGAALFNIPLVDIVTQQGLAV